MGSNDTIEAIVHNKEMSKQGQKTMVATRIPPIIFLKKFLWFCSENQNKLKVSDDAATVRVDRKHKMLRMAIFMLDVETCSMKTVLAR